MADRPSRLALRVPAATDRRGRSDGQRAPTDDHVVGRTDQIERLAEFLAERRLVTIIGPGGVGKTTLARVVAASAPPADGSWFVDLVPTSPDSDVLDAVANALGLRRRNGQTLERTVLDALAVRRILLVIDNCEQVLGGVALMVQELLETAPGVNVLATSREALGIPGEQVFPLAPLSTVSGRAAGKLFIERARAAEPDLSLSVDDRTAIEAIRERLDGLPLAIELAATRRRCLRRGTYARGRRTLQRLRTGELVRDC